MLQVGHGTDKLKPHNMLRRHHIRAAMSTWAGMDTSTSRSDKQSRRDRSSDRSPHTQKMLTGVGVLLAAATNHVEHKRPRCCTEAYQRHFPFQLLRLIMKR